MSSKKKMAAVALTVAALSLGSIGVASAHDRGAARGAGKPAMQDVNREANQAAHHAHRAAIEALVATTVGIDAATIKTRIAAGETLATIAGAKKDALVKALVAFKTKEIDTNVASGKLTPTQATTIKADLTTHVTQMVNSVRGPEMGPKGSMGPMGGKGHGPRH